MLQRGTLGKQKGQSEADGDRDEGRTDLMEDTANTQAWGSLTMDAARVALADLLSELSDELH